MKINKGRNIMFRDFKTWLFTSLLITACTVFSENLLKNGYLDLSDCNEFTSYSNSKQYKFNIFTEDLTWNKCARIDILDYYENKEGIKSVGTGILIGGAKGSEGEDGRRAIVVKPNTVYKFSLTIRGTVNHAGISAFLWDGDCADYKDRKKIKTSLKGVKVQEEWTQYQGEFRTESSTKKAALFIQIWCNQKDGGLTEKPGTYLMIDNVSISEKEEENFIQSKNSSVKIEPRKVCFVPFIEKAPLFDGKLNDEIWKNTGVADAFFKLYGDSKADIQTECRVFADSNFLWFGIKCSEPEISKIKADFKKDGKNVYLDDCVEIFLDSADKNITLHQFIINSIGTRMMTWGNQPKQPGPEYYDKWQAKSSLDKNEWTLEIRIPYETIGLKGKPESGFSMPFNIARERYADKKELSSWSCVNGNFHRKEKYGLLVFGSLKNEAMGRIKKVRSDISAVPPDIPQEALQKKNEIIGNLKNMEKDLADKTDIDIEAWSGLYIDTEKALKEITRLKYSNLKFAVTKVSPTDDFTVPYNPKNINPEIEKTGIEVKAAINEYESLPIAISNLTDTTEAYRVIIFGYENNGIEATDLKSSAGENIFPSSAIEIKEAVRIKDSDGNLHGQKFDPLPEMNKAYTITVPPYESGLVWVTFNCTKVKAGNYNGTVRIIPLNQSAKFVNSGGWKYEGKMKDIPLKFEVLSIELAKDSAIPLNLFRGAINEDFFTNMLSHGVRIFQITSFGFKCSFNDKGEIKDKDSQSVENAIDNHLKWAKKNNAKIKFWVGYSAYHIFFKTHAKEKFKFNSPEWKTAWRNWLKYIEETFAKHGVNKTDYVIEIFDEPKDYEETRQVLAEAKKNLTEARLSVTLGCPLWPWPEIRKLLPYLDDVCIWNGYWHSGDYSALFEEIKNNKISLSFYSCHAANILIPGYEYYGLHMWKAFQRKLDELALFVYLPGPGGYYGQASFKADSHGGVIYNSFNSPITSIRFECLREGVDDVKYITLLDKLTKQSAGKVNPGLTRKCNDFLGKIVDDVVINFPHKNEMAEEVRLKAAELIIELQNALK